jgi:hypothetical protein
MKGRVTVKATKISATPRDVPYSEHSGAPVVTVRVGFATVATLQLGVNVTDLKGIQKHVVPVRNLGWVVILPVTKKIGVVLFVPRSKRRASWSDLYTIQRRESTE